MHYRLDYILKLMLYTANVQTYVHLLGIYVSHIIHKQYVTKIKHYYNKSIEVCMYILNPLENQLPLEKEVWDLKK